MNNKAILEEAVRKAQEDARKKGLNIGQTVAHPNDPITYTLISVDGNIAIVGLTAKQSRNGKKVVKRFPLNELFDPNTAKDFVVKVMEEHLNKKAPMDAGVMVLKLY